MKYLGGKAKLAKSLAPFLIDSLKEKNGRFYEPFTGGFNIVPSIEAHIKKAYCSDVHNGLITLYKKLQQGYKLPININEEQYKRYKETNNYEDPLTAFIAFGCSFGGKEWGGFARGNKNNGSPRNYADESKRNLEKKLLSMGKVSFSNKNYLKLNPKNAVIYCDPPYKDVTGYRTEDFDHNKFYDWCEKVAANNCHVFVSEFNKPRKKNWKIVWSKVRCISVTGKKDQLNKKELLIRVYKK